MHFGESKLNKIGEGKDKEVFWDPGEDSSKYDSPEHKRYVLKIYKGGKRKFGYLENFPKAHARASFYFHKIVNLLFPENFPDVSGAGVNVLRSEKVPLDERHRSIKNVYEMRFQNGNPSAVELEASARASGEIQRDPRYSAIIEEMKKLGIKVDHVEVNYSVDADGNMKYLDDVDPWDHVGIQEIQLSFNEGGLKEAINKLDDEKREKALAYFEHMEKIREEENEKIRKAKSTSTDVTTYI
ncbi:MAG: hypothetical protein HY433_03750 [Candidatus Liptonbacteria bacterium]|nr:hypothetical protein [Candidatus Liptonbacteria bacterium]